MHGSTKHSSEVILAAHLVHPRQRLMGVTPSTALILALHPGSSADAMACGQLGRDPDIEKAFADTSLVAGRQTVGCLGVRTSYKVMHRHRRNGRTAGGRPRQPRAGRWGWPGTAAAPLSRPARCIAAPPGRCAAVAAHLQGIQSVYNPLVCIRIALLQWLSTSRVFWSCLECERHKVNRQVSTQDQSILKMG